MEVGVIERSPPPGPPDSGTPPAGVLSDGPLTKPRATTMQRAQRPHQRNKDRSSSRNLYRPLGDLGRAKPIAAHVVELVLHVCCTKPISRGSGPENAAIEPSRSLQNRAVGKRCEDRFVPMTTTPREKWSSEPQNKTGATGSQ